MVISPAQENTAMLKNNHDYENVFSFNVVAIGKNQNKGKNVVYDEFGKQLSKSPEEWYETNLLAKDWYSHLNSNNSVRMERVNEKLKLKQAISGMILYFR